MSIYKRGKVWWIKITIPGAKQVQISARTRIKKEAQEYHDKLRAELWRQSTLDEKPERLWEEAVIRYIEENSHKKSLNDDKRILRWLYPHLEGMPLSNINRDRIDRIFEHAPHRSPATHNRYTAIIRALLRKAHREWEWISSVPAFRIRKEPHGKIRWITRQQAMSLIDALPDHLKAPCRFALATGLRQANVFKLRWDHIDLSRRVAWVTAERSKSSRPISIPLNSDAMAVLLGENEHQQHPRRVFTYAGKPFDRFENATWNRALAAAGLEDFRWHDLRHTWASWHVQSGTSLQKLMELGGWSSYEMVLRYAHLAPDHLRDAAENISLAQNVTSIENINGKI